MAEIPMAFLPHTVQVTPYAGANNAPGSAYTLRCLIDARVGRKIPDRGKVGEVPPAEITIFARTASNCPIGSRIVLPDGRVGYASASSVFDGGYLPTPSHLEILWTAGWTAAEVDEYV